MSLTEGQKGKDKQGKEERKSWEGGRRGVQNEEKKGGFDIENWGNSISDFCLVQSITEPHSTTTAVTSVTLRVCVTLRGFVPFSRQFWPRGIVISLEPKF